MEKKPQVWEGERLAQSPTIPMSTIMQWKQKYYDKEGRNVYANIKLQYFYDQHGSIRWMVGCLDHWSYEHDLHFLEYANTCCGEEEESANPLCSSHCSQEQLASGTTAPQQTPSSAFTLPPEQEQLPLELETLETFDTAATSCTDFSASPIGQHPSSSSASPACTLTTPSSESEEPIDAWIESVMRAPNSSPLVSPLFSVGSSDGFY